MIFGFDSNLTVVPTEIYLYGIATSILLMMIFTRVYFQKSKIKPHAVSGAYFGFTTIAVGFFLDFLIGIVPLLFAEHGPNILAYYSHPLFWVNLAAIPLTSAITGSYMQKSSLPISKRPSKKSFKKS